MASRIELHKVLEDILGSKNVYYQPPGRMEYPCIKYSRSRIDATKADDSTYLTRKRYELTVIANLPDNPAIDKILELPYASHDRQFKSDNLYHDVIILYF